MIDAVIKKEISFMVVEYKDSLLDAVERLKASYFSIIERVRDNPFKIEYVADKYLNLFSKLLNKNVN